MVKFRQPFLNLNLKVQKNLRPLTRQNYIIKFHDAFAPYLLI